MYKLMNALFCLITGVGLLGLITMPMKDGTLEIAMAHAESHSAKGSNFTNFIGMKFVGIPAGSFYMGSCKPGMVCSSGSSDSDAKDNETPQHKVRISKGFQMGMYEVTLGQFKQFIAGASRSDLLNDDFRRYNNHGDQDAVTKVSWNDAQAFIHWLNKKERSYHYRLPTEAEWEYAARAGRQTVYSWGNSKNVAGRYAWYDENAYNVGAKYTHAVGVKQPNAWGLYDMHGNAWEWVEDWYDARYYRNSPVTDPAGPRSGQYRVNRGGSWNNFVKNLRSANRNWNSPDLRKGIIGFRLVREAH